MLLLQSMLQPQLQHMPQLLLMAQLPFMQMSHQHMTMVMLSMMDTVVPTLLPMRTEMVTPPMENTVLPSLMVALRLSPTMFLMPSQDMLLMSSMRDNPLLMLLQHQLMPQPLLFLPMAVALSWLPTKLLIFVIIDTEYLFLINN
jgi:hypothetical protein